MLGTAAALAAEEGAAQRQRRLLQNVRKLKAKVMDTSTLLELYSQAQERERQLEARIVQLESATRAARAAANSRIEALQRERDALEVDLREAGNREATTAAQLRTTQATVEKLRASQREQQKQIQRQAAASAVAAPITANTSPARSAGGAETSTAPCPKCAAAAHEAARERTSAQEALRAKRSAESALDEARRGWAEERQTLELRLASGAASAALQVAAAAARDQAPDGVERRSVGWLWCASAGAAHHLRRQGTS